MKNPDLFSEFDKPSDAAWKQKIQVALKGADYQSTLVWNSPEGIATKPFYTAEDYPELPAIELPKDWTLTQGLGFYADEQPLSFRSLKILSEEGRQQGMEAFWVESFIPKSKEERTDVPQSENESNKPLHRDAPGLVLRFNLLQGKTPKPNGHTDNLSPCILEQTSTNTWTCTTTGCTGY